ncbi:nitrous oxide-stimulated promoter family protein [uncultured Bacteroides sp.]|uniref:nitrous oxide-stimulated promoter family protein n=1 Tax=uncultured Bacteroides sp. TaxID=162156 RepID=UPI002AAC1E44|nr:nitrous oxide-stimulated promoter family protein [uncultured Bacteroides sp.]
MDKITYEKKIMGKMIGLYCRLNHREDVLCAECKELFDYAALRLDKCRYGQKKGACAKCSTHCYKPAMREKIKKVMRFSGPRMLLYHPLDAFRHLLGK